MGLQVAWMWKYPILLSLWKTPKAMCVLCLPEQNKNYFLVVLTLAYPKTLGWMLPLDVSLYLRVSSARCSLSGFVKPGVRTVVVSLFQDILLVWLFLIFLTQPPECERPEWHVLLDTGASGGPQQPYLVFHPANQQRADGADAHPDPGDTRDSGSSCRG